MAYSLGAFSRSKTVQHSKIFLTSAELEDQWSEDLGLLKGNAVICLSPNKKPTEIKIKVALTALCTCQVHGNLNIVFEKKANCVVYCWTFGGLWGFLFRDHRCPPQKNPLCWRSLWCCWTSCLELSAYGRQTARLVIQQSQTVAENILNIWHWDHNAVWHCFNCTIKLLNWT